MSSGFTTRLTSMLGAAPIGSQWRRHASYRWAMTPRISSYEGVGHPAMSEPMVGRKMHTVGNAPASAMRSIASSVCPVGSMPAITSPDTAPCGSSDAQYRMASK